LNPEVAIIGAGPSGLLAASQISRLGYNVTVFEEHQTIGEPNHCSGLISAKGLKRLDIDLSKKFIENKIHGGKVYCPNGDFILFKEKKVRAYVVNRSDFDKYVAEQAQDFGVEIKLGIKIKKLLRNGEKIIGLKTSNDKILSDIIINGEGVNRRLLFDAKIIDNHKNLLNGFNVELTEVTLDPNLVEVWFNENISKGLFGWVIPLNKEKARIGLATSRNDAYECLKRFILQRFNLTQISGVRTGIVSTSGPLKRTAWPGMMVVGDAAGHTKPTTGGGVVFGGLCAKIAGETAVKALETEDYSMRVLELYEKKWRKLYQRELLAMLALRKLLNKLSNDKMNSIFYNMRETGLTSAFHNLIREGDMDMQSEVMRKALMNPKILKLLINTIGKFTLSEITSILK
jgi:digeranylgeranylglycerophospholipid reductase